ncbi:MAG: peptidase T [Christensenellales bacterium]|nr:peptidase T [Christensenellales bacterium]
MRAYERLLKYVSVYTTSDPDSATVPSSMRQYDLAHQLVEELKALGLENVHVDENCVVYGWLSATAGCEKQPALGFIAHMDTAPDCAGENVKPQIIENYDGGDVQLAGSGEKLSPAAFPTLKKLAGMTLITTDGTTLLGADDKAGIAEIMTALESIISEKKPHGKLCIAFTPDEEVGAGVDHFDVEKFGAVYAYTVDGGEEGEIAYETFNACSAEVAVEGLSVHPGSAKDTMINAALVAMEFNALLPAADIPRLTEGYEGFFHLCDMSGDVEHAKLHYIVRDHDRATFEMRKKTLEHAAKTINEKYAREVIRLTIKDSYYNMAEKIAPHMELIENAKRACEKAGMKPFIEAVRGGTDGCRLSFMGLPTPNLCTGGFAFHGPYEHITVESMDRCAKMVEYLMLGE